MNNEEYFKSKIEIMLKAYQDNNTSLVSYRRNLLQEIHKSFTENGYPKALTKEELSLIPLHFQEAMYDGINWENQDAGLGHLEFDFQIDCIFQNEGKTRNELSPEEFKKYVDYSYSIVKRLVNQNHR